MATRIFIVTVPAGTGGGFYIDGVQKPTLDLAKGATYRFDVSDASNSVHPFRFSTNANNSPSSPYTTGVTTSGTQGNPGAYVEIDLTSTSTDTLYYYCTNHSGMGGQLNLTADSWGALSWNVGSWGEQDNVTEILTGFNNSISLNSVDAFPNQGWGSDSWGVENWGESGNVVTLTGIGLSIDSGQTDIAIGQQINALGQQLNISLNNVTEVITVDAFPQGIELTTNLGTLDPAPDAELTGQQLNIGVGTVSAYNEQGWGRDAWGTEVWGAQGIWSFVDVTGQQLNTSTGSITTESNVDVQLTTTYDPGWGNIIGWGQQTWGQATAESALEMPAPTDVEVDPDTALVGQQLNISLEDVTITADANLSLSGFALEIAQGTAILDALTPVNVTGQRLNISLNSVVPGASAEVDPTGNALTIASGSINVQSWQIVDTGSNVNWNIIDTAA
jgi:hypothetical protein